MLLANDVQLELLNQFEKLSMLLCHLPLVVKQSNYETFSNLNKFSNPSITPQLLGQEFLK